MTNFITALEQLADQFNKQVQSVPGAVPIDTKNYGWDNYRYSSPVYRMAHVEKFVQRNFAVVHTCVFPHVTDPSPIFGFDIIAGENKATGLFFDLSPTVEPSVSFSKLALQTQRERPVWGDIFSEHWVACRPSFEEFQLIAQEATQVLDQYLGSLGHKTVNPDHVIVAQNRYCQQQKQNEHTFAALRRLLGHDGAQEFMNSVLFPEI